MSDLASSFLGKEAMITGGLGMIGSTIARKLVKHGACVTIVDACLEPYGANMFNVDEIKDQIRISKADIRDTEAMRSLVKGKDFIFNLAGQVSHNDSINDPFLDANINYLGHLNVLENIKKSNPETVVVHAGSRLQFGKIQRSPVDEEHPLRPRTPYALNKTAAENMYLFYREMHGIPCVLFRIANPYGPRSQMKHGKYSIVNWFLRLAMENKTISIFGDGKQVRDYIYVDDVADAFLHAAANPRCHGKTFNIGSGKGTEFRHMVELIVATVGSGRVEYVPWPDTYFNVETGDYTADIRKITNTTDWKPHTDLKTGIELSYQYYSKNRDCYWL